MAQANGGPSVYRMNAVTLSQFKDDLRRLKQEAVDDLSRKMDELIEHADFSAGSNVLMKSYSGEAAADGTKQRRKKGGELPEKEFIMQNSVLTDLFQSKHFQTIENMVIAALILWALVTAVSDYFEKRSLRAVLPSPDLIERAFHNYQTALTYWIRLMFFAFLIYPITHFWANHRPASKPNRVNSVDQLFFAFYVLFQLYFLLLPYDVLFGNPILGPAAAVAVSMEQIRLMMKIHSFVREVTKRIRRDEESQVKKDDGDASVSPQLEEKSAYSPKPSNFPGFSRYLYFLFAPTLIYRDVYPRTESVNWYYVSSNFLQLIGSCIYIYYVVQRYLMPEFKIYSPSTVSIETIINSAFRCIVPGACITMMAFFGFLHSWLNAWAEMLRFGDRLFYKDWWNVGSYAEYYRTWNCVVHDWLYTYVYKDSQELLKLKKVKFTSACMVFGLSAIFHEYVVMALLKFFFPVLLVEFGGAGFPLIFLKSSGRLSNVFMWASYMFGMGLMISLYSFEISARSVCPPVHDDFFDYFIPRFWTCMQG